MIRGKHTIGGFCISEMFVSYLGCFESHYDNSNEEDEKVQY